MNKTTKARRHGGWNLLSLCLCASVVFIACSSTSKMKPDAARKVIAQELRVPEERIEVKDVSAFGGTIVAEGTLKITSLLQKNAQGKWTVVSMKYSGDWQTPEEFLKSVPEKSSLTRSIESALLAELNREDR